MVPMLGAAIGEGVRRKFAALAAVLDERSRRQWAAAEPVSLAWGGVSMVSAATGLSRTTVNAGVRQLRERAGPGAVPVDARVRRPAGGGKPLAAVDTAIVAALDELVGPGTRGDPMSPLRWTPKTTAKLAAGLTRRGQAVSARAVAALPPFEFAQGRRRTACRAAARPTRDRPTPTSP